MVGATGRLTVSVRRLGWGGLLGGLVLLVLCECGWFRFSEVVVLGSVGGVACLFGVCSEGAVLGEGDQVEAVLFCLPGELLVAGAGLPGFEEGVVDTGVHVVRVPGVGDGLESVPMGCLGCLPAPSGADLVVVAEVVE